MSNTGKRRAYAPRVLPEQRRRELLDAALHLVVSRGHDAATVEAVAEQAGVTKPVLYGVFAGRSDLLEALLRRETAAALEQLAGVLPSEPAAPLDDLVNQMLAGFLGAVRDAPQRWHCVVMPMPGMPAEFHAARDEARRVILGQVAELVAGLVDAGALPRDLDLELTAHALVGLAEMAARLVLTDPDAYPVERFTAALRAVPGLG